MTFWTKLQHELLCFVCAEDEIFDFAESIPVIKYHLHVKKDYHVTSLILKRT